MPTLPELFQIPDPGKETLPVKVGEADKTKLVVPVEPETSDKEEIKLASVAEVPNVPPEPVVTNRLAVKEEKVTVPPTPKLPLADRVVK